MQTTGTVAFDAFEGHLTSLENPPTMLMVGICKWDDLPTEQKVAWEAAGRAVLDFLVNQQTEPCCRHHHD